VPYRAVRDLAGWVRNPNTRCRGEVPSGMDSALLDVSRKAPAGREEIVRFLTYLAINLKVRASTQKQAVGAPLFLYRDVLGKNFDWLDGIARATRPSHLRVVLSRVEVALVLRHLAIHVLEDGYDIV